MIDGDFENCFGAWSFFGGIIDDIWACGCDSSGIVPDLLSDYIISRIWVIAFGRDVDDKWLMERWDSLAWEDAGI